MVVTEELPFPSGHHLDKECIILKSKRSIIKSGTNSCFVIMSLHSGIERLWHKSNKKVIAIFVTHLPFTAPVRRIHMQVNGCVYISINCVKIYWVFYNCNAIKSK